MYFSVTKNKEIQCTWNVLNTWVHPEDKKTDSQYNKRCKQNFVKLYNVPQYEQRSDEWFKQRLKFITASDGASPLFVDNEIMKKYHDGELLLTQKNCRIGAPLNPYTNGNLNKVNELLSKKVTGVSNFKGNEACEWGKAFEPVATCFYEQFLAKRKVIEFGLMPHRDSINVPFLGASPDGITEDGKRMLEIKCPFSNRTVGPPASYYWVQMQLQMECCNIDVCDFLDCRIREFRNKEEFLSDTTYPIKGIILEIADERYGSFDKDRPRDYVCPPKIFISSKDNFESDMQELDDWLSEWAIAQATEDPHGYIFRENKKRVFKRYWYISHFSCIAVHRDKAWFKRTLPIYKEFWDKVLYYREHKDEFEKVVLGKTNYTYIRLNTTSSEEEYEENMKRKRNIETQRKNTLRGGPFNKCIISPSSEESDGENDIIQTQILTQKISSFVSEKKKKRLLIIPSESESESGSESGSE